MDIKVYISLPHNEKNHERWRDIMKRLRNMVDNTKVSISSFGTVRTRGPYPDLDELITLVHDVSSFTEVHFVVFGNGWETDRRSQIEHAVAVLYNIPHCGEDEIETFFRGYVANLFKFDIKEGGSL